MIAFNTSWSRAVYECLVFFAIGNLLMFFLAKRFDNVLKLVYLQQMGSSVEE